MSEQSDSVRSGWGWPARSNKAHYFHSGCASLCGKWGYLGEVENDKHRSPDNCKECMKRREKLFPTEPAQ
jgi:hypothetical protein